MKSKIIVTSIFSFFLLTFFFTTAQSEILEGKNIQLQLSPAEAYVGDEASIFFKATYSHSNSATAQIPQILTLVEWNENQSEIKYHWELKDDGSQGDELPGDGIYSRIIQFKEKKVKSISFWVTDEVLAANTNPTSVFLHKTSPQLPHPDLIPDSQKATLQILARPTFQDILFNAYQKIKNRFQ